MLAAACEDGTKIAQSPRTIAQASARYDTSWWICKLQRSRLIDGADCLKLGLVVGSSGRNVAPRLLVVVLHHVVALDDVRAVQHLQKLRLPATRQTDGFHA